MRTQQKPTVTKLAKRIDQELMNILRNDLRALRETQFLNAIQLKAA